MTDPGNSKGWTFNTLAIAGLILIAGVASTITAVILGMEKATAVALTAADEKGVAHNGLIDRMREMSKQYVTWPTVMLLMALAVSVAALVMKR
jgi:hypothetical protein